MNNLFVYGSLMYPVVRNKLISKNYPQIPVYLPNFKRTIIKNQLYPGVVKKMGNGVDGLLLMGLASADIKKLDRFEGEYYQRCPVYVVDSDNNRYKAETYIIKNRYKKLLSNTDWKPGIFENKIHLFLSHYKNFHS